MMKKRFLHFFYFLGLIGIASFFNLTAQVYAQSTGIPVPMLEIHVDTYEDLLPSESPDCNPGHTPQRCSLREAITNISRTQTRYSNQYFRINLPAGTLRLEIEKPRTGVGEDNNLNGDLDIRMTNNNTLQIIGSISEGGGQSTIEMRDYQDWNPTLQDRVLHLVQGNLFLKDIRITGGFATRSFDYSTVREGTGGGILVNPQGSLYAENLLVDSNRTNDGCGGGISNSGRLHLVNSALMRNSISGSGRIRHRIGDNNLYDYISSGGGLCNYGTSAHVVLDRVSIFENTAFRYGGGIYNAGNGYINLINSTVANNAVENGYFLQTNGSSSVEYPYGEGGGIYNATGGFIQILNSTIVYNRARLLAGGISNGSYGMPVGAISEIQPGRIEIANSIVLENTSPFIDVDWRIWGRSDRESFENTNCMGSLISLGSNLSNSTCNSLAIPGNVRVTSGTPVLNPAPQNSPGHGYIYYALVEGSPAIRGVQNPGTCPSFDQRDVERPRGEACDIGSYEYITLPPPVRRPMPSAIMPPSIEGIPLPMPSGGKTDKGSQLAPSATTPDTSSIIPVEGAVLPPSGKNSTSDSSLELGDKNLDTSKEAINPKE